jgi:hypothetical protein
MGFAFADFLTGIGFVLVIEGALLALAPESMKRFVAAMWSAPPRKLRIGGLAAAAAGVALVWAVRG